MAEYQPYVPLGFGAMPFRVPRGEDVEGPLAYQQPPREMYSPLSPAGNALMGPLINAGASPAIGPGVDMLTRLGKATGQTAADMTMIPWANQTLNQLAESAARHGVVPDFLKGGGEAQAAEGDRLSTLLAQKEKLMNDRATAMAARDDQRKGKGGAKAGEGPEYNKKDQEVKDLTAQINSTQSLIDREYKMQDPEYQRQQRLLEQQAADERAKVEANKPFREKYPAFAQSLPNYGIALSMGVPGALGAMRNARTAFPGSPARSLDTAITENLAARAGGPKATPAQQQAEAVSRAQMGNILGGPEWYNTAKGTAKTAMEGAAGGGLAAETAMYPDQFDWFNLPPGPEKDAARKRALDYMAFLERAGVSSIAGVSANKTVRGIVPEYPMQTYRAQGLMDTPPPWWGRRKWPPR